MITKFELYNESIRNQMTAKPVNDIADSYLKSNNIDPTETFNINISEKEYNDMKEKDAFQKHNIKVYDNRGNDDPVYTHGLVGVLKDLFNVFMEINVPPMEVVKYI